MSRLARIVVPQFPHHVTQRGNAGRDVFFTPADRHVYLGLLKKYARHHGLRIIGYCLMTNHVHLVVVPEFEASLAKALREVHGRYSQYRNAIEKTTGHLWQSRYYSCPVQGVELGRVMRYVELNPVRAGLASSAGDYRWSSAISHLGGDDPDGIVEQTEWTGDWTPEEWEFLLGNGVDDSVYIREATFAGRPLGTDRFVAEVEHKLDREIAKKPMGRPSKAMTKIASAF